jgi:hypothetical protein
MADTTEAPWWDGPHREGWQPVVRHSPDNDQYHVPDQDQLRQMRGSPVGKFATIPAARKDGRSQGFDPSIAGPVHVDPGAPDGGVIFDPASVNAEELAGVVATSEFPHQAYYRLGRPAARRGAVEFEDTPQRTNPLRPGAYVVPAAATTGQQIPYPQTCEIPMATQPVPPLSALPPLTAPAPSPILVHQFSPAMAPAAQVQTAPAYQPPPMDTYMAQMMQSMMQQMGRLTAVVDGMQQAQMPIVPPVTGVSRNPMPVGRPLASVPAELQRTKHADDDFSEDARPIRSRRPVEDEEEAEPKTSLVRQQAAKKQKVADFEKDETKEVITGFETLGIPWVTGPIADKARVQVFFNLPTGRVAAKFHDVIEGEGCLVLIYDTRFEDGQQYLPQDCSDTPITVEVPSRKLSKRVMSMGITASLGCFDQVILVEAGVAPIAPQGDEEE